MKYITTTACLLAFAIALAAMWPQAHPLKSSPSYTVKQFCVEHPGICSHSRLAHYSTPSPIPSKGYVVIYP